MSKKLAAALLLRQNAEQHVEEILKHDYPVGARINWLYADQIRSGIVTMNCHGDRIKVRNAATGRELFIHAYRIVA